jgi:hypothetical protein
MKSCQVAPHQPVFATFVLAVLSDVQCCQWEPQPAVLDAHDAGWTCVADCAINISNQLVAVTFNQQFCGVWAANLSASQCTALHPRQDVPESSSLKLHPSSSAAPLPSASAPAKLSAAVAAATARVHADERLPGV